jgi:cytoskeletal protein CcmA (bactofilin family)
MANRSTTVIGAGTVVSGRVEGAEDLHVLGTLKGTLRLEGELLVDAEARVEADAEVTAAVIHGIYVGNVVASERVELSASARVLGDLTAPRVIVADGAAYAGVIDMGDVESAIGEAPPKRPAPAPARPGARPAPAPARPAPPPARPAAPARPTLATPPRPTPRPAAPPAPAAQEAAPAMPEPEEPAEPEGEEPELPEGAAPKKVSVRKKK